MAEENKQAQQPQQDIGELLKIRREKLSALQEEGNDPLRNWRVRRFPSRAE